jgi:hypothetical protein
MQRPRVQPIRNKLDLNDRVQMRIVTKRLGITPSELNDLVGRIGNSISALAKEVHLQRARKLAPPTQVPPAAVIASVTAAETGVADLTTPAETTR